MNNRKMPNYLKEPCGKRIPGRAHFRTLIAYSIMLLAVFQSACLFSKKSKADIAPTAPVRLVLLPFNVPQSNAELRWTALAAPILMAKTGVIVPNLELVPLWQTMPYAIENGGASRMFTQDSAINVANWLSAKWVVLGEITPTKRGVSMVIDFIPTRSSMVPFRYVKSGGLDAVGAGFYDAYNQFLRYLVAKPLTQPRNDKVTLSSTKELAETLDREYGWFSEADPGKASETLKQLMTSDEPWARSLFSPIVYTSLAEKK